MVHYKVTLTDAEREELKGIMNKCKHSSQQFRNACILLNCDASVNDGKQPFTNEQVAGMLQINTKT
ncbi:MAG: IS630 family transposase, partial [Parafilimonas sp.]